MADSVNSIEGDGEGSGDLNREAGGNDIDSSTEGASASAARDCITSATLLSWGEATLVIAQS